jgi:hypothetical protein
VSPTLILIGFGLNAKATIEPATVFKVWAVVVVVGLTVVVVVGLTVVVVVGLTVVVVVGLTVVVVIGLTVVVVIGLTVVVDPLVVLAEIGGLVDWLDDEGRTVSRVD